MVTWHGVHGRSIENVLVTVKKTKKSNIPHNAQQSCSTLNCSLLVRPNPFHSFSYNYFLISVFYSEKGNHNNLFKFTIHLSNIKHPDVRFSITFVCLTPFNLTTSRHLNRPTPIHYFIHSFIHQFNHSFIHSSIHSSMHAFINS